MRLLKIISLAVALACASASPNAVAAPSVERAAASAASKASCGADHYRNIAGRCVHRPTRTPGDRAPAGASARCRDGTYSFSQSRRGTCSHHGGVVRWL